MRVLMLDLHNTRRPVALPNLLLLLFSLATALGLALYTLQTFSEVEKLELQQRTFEHDSRQTVEPRPSPKDQQQLHDEIKDANEVLARIGLPWERLFQDIESSPRDNIALLSINPDAVKRRLTITGEAKSLDDMLNYIRKLQEKGSMTRVFHHVELKSAQHPIHFIVEASWERAT